MKVICIDDRPPLDPLNGARLPNGYVAKGEEYTVITQQGQGPNSGVPHYVLEEKPAIDRFGRQLGWGAFRFVTPAYYEAEFSEHQTEFQPLNQMETQEK